MQETAFPKSTEIRSGKRPKALVILLAFLLVLSALIYLGVRVFGSDTPVGSASQQDSTSAVQNTAETVPAETTEGNEEVEELVTPTEAELNRADLVIRILNGSGTSGVAGRMSTVLKSAGYTDITTGNADRFDYEDISISVKSTKENFLKLLETDLKDSYTIGDTDTSLTSDLYDVVIIIGT